MSEPIKSSNGSLFVQLTPGKQPEYLGCIDLDPIAAPSGDQSLINCRNRNGDVEAIGSTSAPPGAVTTSLKALVFPETNILDSIKSCLVNVFALSRDCGKAGIFSNYVWGVIVGNARVSARNFENIVMREADEPTIKTLDIAGRSWHEPRKLAVTAQTIAETSPLNDIVFCNDEQCAGDCGAQKDAGTDGFIVTDGTSPSPGSDADVWSTDDKGVTWVNATSALTTPFSAGVDAMSAVCFAIDRDTTRLLVARGIVGAQAAQVAYSDDDGASWTSVTVGSTLGEGATGHGALFALDNNHIWFATSGGRIYISEDAGVSWTSQATALVASAAKSLNEVMFVNETDGWAVGNTDAVIRTTDGGDTWTALTAPTTADNVTTVFAWSKYRAIIGSNADTLYQTWDGGTNWEAKVFTGQSTTGTVKDIKFYNDLLGFMLHNTSAPVGSVHRSIDGGHTWEKLTTPTNAGLNALAVIDGNTAHAVGEVSGTYGVALKIAA